ncbi:MAG TPA: methyltransferase domain-containing protein [Longimicrobium sp.]|nr:methyltransferase domain-containing protein [Longimicrobium sp.]HSU17085.1 methyltransferase domain-containing protein [Longimicrobium sp.]
MRGAGTFTISIDTEFAWGVRHYGELAPGRREEIRREREIVTRLLALFSRYDVRATWAVVGRLLERDPGVAEAELDLWYTPDVIEEIAAAVPRQEIGSHSYAHLFFDEGAAPREAAEADVAAARRVHEQHGLAFDSWVFPRSIVGYRDVLARAGVRVYRGAGRRWYSGLPVRPVRRVLNLGSFAVGATPRTVRPRVDELGMTDVPDSMLLFGRGGVRRLVPPRSLVRMASAGLERAARRGEVFHLYFHPSNFAHDTDTQFRILEEILAHAQSLRSANRLEIRTMGELHQNTGSAGVADERMIEFRRAALEFHNDNVGRFENHYRQAAADPFTSSFTYGRRQLDRELDSVLDTLPQGAAVLDIGCGTGEHLKAMRERGLTVTGLEPAPNMRAAAQRTNPGVQIVDGSVLALPFPDNSFDFLIATEVLRYFDRKDIRRAYAEMLRVLKPGGRMFFTMVNLFALDMFNLHYAVRRVAAKALGRTGPVPTEFVTPGEVRRELLELGAGDVEMRGRVFAPVRIAYKLNRGLGRMVGRALDGFDQKVSGSRWHVPLAGHLVAIARK